MKELSSTRSPSLQNLTSDGYTPSGPAPTLRFRVVILGASKVGKTSLVERFLGRTCPVRHRPTVEEMHQVDVVVQGFKVTLELLDTSGTYEFPAMRRLAYDKGDAFLLVCSLDDPESFETVRTIRQEILERRGKVIPAMVVANKTDLTPAFPKTDIEMVVRMDWEYLFVECSALKDKEVTPAFSQLLVDLVRLDDALHYPCLTPQETGKKKNKRGISLPMSHVQPVLRKTKTPLIKRHSCVIS